MKQIEADVAVIGGGASGLAAAVAAAECGARVAVLEKASTTGGAANMGMGLFAVESRLQQERKMTLTREEAFRIFMDYTHWRVDARLVRAYIDKSASTIAWLEKQGVEFYEPEAHFPGSHFTWHTVKIPTGGSGGGGGALMIKILTDKVVELGGQVLLQTPARKILREGGHITGIIAEDSSGEEVKVNAGAVIVSTGGFGDNPDMIKKHTGLEYGKDLFSIRIPGLVGEGIRMAWEAGAAPTEMTMELIFSFPPPFNGRSGTRPELTAFRQPNLMVNILGERFMNEEIIGNTTFTGNAIHRQKDHCAFIIFDEDTKRYYEESGMHYCPIPENIYVKSIDDNIKKVLDEGCRCVFVVDSLEELAVKTGIDPDGLQKTVDEYNRACETGRDELFNKSYKYLRPVKQPRFYAGKFYPSAYGSLGGIKINQKMEVLNKDYGVIPGFYATGVDANTIYGDSYIFIFPGNTMGFAINSGRMAGENAAEYIKSMTR